MRRTSFFLVAAAALVAGSVVSRAEGDPRVEARLLTFDGKFGEAEEVLKKAGPEVAGDPELRLQLADTALKFLRGKTGEERRAGLEAMKHHYAAALEKNAGLPAAVEGAILAAKEIGQLDLAKRKPDDAKNQASFAVSIGEKAAAAGMTPETKAALAEAYGLRASVTRKVDAADQVCADFEKGAAMLEEAAAGHARESAWLAAAADMRFQQAFWVHDLIPIETEKRDDAALAAAVALARRACEAKSAADAAYLLHIRTLCAAREWKLPGDFGQPFMKPLEPAYEGLTLLVPKGADWKVQPKTPEWDLILERRYDTNDSGVQLMVTALNTKTSIGGRPWSDLENCVPTLFEQRKSGYDDVSSETAPMQFGEKKKGPHLWHFALAGTVKNSTRRNKMVEFLWPSTTKKDTTWDVRVVDWRNASAIEDPDIVAFVNSAIPKGWWPPGSAPPPEDPKKKKPGGTGGKKK